MTGHHVREDKYQQNAGPCSHILLYVILLFIGIISLLYHTIWSVNSSHDCDNYG